jgi:hypothetical protein
MCGFLGRSLRSKVGKERFSENRYETAEVRIEELGEFLEWFKLSRC